MVILTIYGNTCLRKVYPEHKYLIVAALQQMKYETREPVGMTGDGNMHADTRLYDVYNVSDVCACDGCTVCTV